MPVGELLRRMDSRELTEWMAYFALQQQQAGAEPKSASAADIKAAFAHRVRKAGSS